MAASSLPPLDLDPDLVGWLAVTGLALGAAGLLLGLAAYRRAGRPPAAPVRAPRVDGADDALRHVSVVRYDAFGDVGGRQSFSAALVDDAGDGLVLTCLNGRSDSRTYAKELRGGASEHALSPEEQQALHGARVGS